MKTLECRDDVTLRVHFEGQVAAAASDDALERMRQLRVCLV